MDRPSKLLGQMRDAPRARLYGLRTERAYCACVRRFIYLHHVRHPAETGEPGTNAFLDVRTVMIYTHVLNRGGHGVRSPLDALQDDIYSLRIRDAKGGVTHLGSRRQSQEGGGLEA